MSIRQTRGACPSLSRPMETGDGLLVRLSPASRRITHHQLFGIAEAAARDGNGLLEVTRRGNLQIRGLDETSAKRFAAAVSALDIDVASGIPVETGPLAGMDASEVADPRPLVDAIRNRTRELAARLGPKVSVTVDGGGNFHLGALLADVKLTAVAGGWRVAIGGDANSARTMGVMDATGAVDATLDVLTLLAKRGRRARARDLHGSSGFASLPPGSGDCSQPSPVGTFALRDGSCANGFALAFGLIDSIALRDFASALRDGSHVHLAPGGGLIVSGLSSMTAAGLCEQAERLGLVTRPDDTRLSITACAGGPACGAAWVATRSMAAELAAHGAIDQTVHLSGCSKGCARPATPAATLTGTPQGVAIEGAPSPELHAALTALGRKHFIQREIA